MSKISEKKRIVIKIGTSSLTHRTGRVNIRRVEQFVKTVADLHNMGKEIVLVSSGAVGLGMAKLGMQERPADTPSKQACAAVGQCELMYLYDNLFAEYSLTVAQLLLTKFVLQNGRDNVENVLRKLLSFNAIPIVNENDTVAIDELELEVGENDSLAAVVATLSNADLLVILTDIDGLYDGDPRTCENAKLITKVTKITDEIRNIAGGAGAQGRGGMATKIRAAEICAESGIDMVIMNGANPKKLYDLFEDKQVGTVFGFTENKDSEGEE